MNLTRFAFASLLPLSIFACASPSSEAAASSADAITTTEDLGSVEANLGLEKDVDRTRSEDVVTSGPCYKQMNASGRTWNMRRYTKGAAFFFTDEAGEPLDALECIDLDVFHNGTPATMALNGLALDVVQRFELGRFDWTASIGTPTDGTALLKFAKGSIELKVVKQATEDASYLGGFSGVIRAVDSPSFNVPAVVSVREFMPAVANMAYRHQGTDIGRFVSIENTTAAATDEPSWTIHFEHADIRYSVSGAGECEHEWLSLVDHSGKELAKQERCK